MALVTEWEVTITPISVVDKTASISAVRTVVDDAAPEVILETETHRVLTAILDTAAQKAAVLDSLWQQHLDYQVEQTDITAYLGGLEAAGKIDLEGREP